MVPLVIWVFKMGLFNKKTSRTVQALWITYQYFPFLPLLIFSLLEYGSIERKI